MGHHSFRGLPFNHPGSSSAASVSPSVPLLDVPAPVPVPVPGVASVVPVVVGSPVVGMGSPLESPGPPLLLAPVESALAASPQAGSMPTPIAPADRRRKLRRSLMFCWFISSNSLRNALNACFGAASAFGSPNSRSRVAVGRAG